MTKDQLIEAMANYPGDAPILVAIGIAAQKASPDEFMWYNEVGGSIRAISVSGHPAAIVLEL